MPDNATPLRQPAPAADNTDLQRADLQRGDLQRGDLQRADLQREIASLIVQALNLDIAPSDIKPGAALYGGGLGLDSIDILEIALVVSKQYGIQLRADSEENGEIFRSLGHLSAYIAAHRTK